MEPLTTQDLHDGLQQLVPLLRTELRNELQRFFPAALSGSNGHNSDCHNHALAAGALNVASAGGTPTPDSRQSAKGAPFDPTHKPPAASEGATHDYVDSEAQPLRANAELEKANISVSSEVNPNAAVFASNVVIQGVNTALADDASGETMIAGIYKNDSMDIQDGQVSFHPPRTREARSSVMWELEEFKPHEEIEQGQKWRGYFRRIVQSNKFDYLIGILVITNAVTIGIQTDWMATNLEDMPPLWSRVIDYLFCCIFTLEITVRIFVFRIEFFRKSTSSSRAGDLFWNMFDCVVVVQQLTEVVIEIGVAFASSGSRSTSAGNLGVIRVLRVLRLVRIMRLARILHLIAELRAIVCSILGSLRPFFWTVLLLVVMMYIVGVYFTQLVMEFRVNLKDEAKEDPSDLRKYYHGLARTLLSLYQAMSGGVDWENMVEPLIVNISPFLGLVFSLYIAFAVLAMMNVVTGVFVEAALTSAKADQRQNIAANMKEFLRVIPKHQNYGGAMDVHEIESRFQDKDLVEFFTHIGVDASEAKFMLSMLDSTSGYVTTEEILNALDHLQQGPKRLDIRLLMRETTRIKSNQQKLKTTFARHMGNLTAAIISRGHVEHSGHNCEVREPLSL